MSERSSRKKAPRRSTGGTKPKKRKLPVRAQERVTWYTRFTWYRSRDTQGSRDIGDSLILNTQVVTLMKTSGCWWLLWPKSSPKSYICHQHILSPTSVTNIDVTFRLGRWIFYSTRFKTSKNKKSKFDDQYFESEESWDIQSQLHLLCPSITENGTISTKIRRLVEHTMHLELSCFLLDHSREREALFKKLQGIIHRWYT